MLKQRKLVILSALFIGVVFISGCVGPEAPKKEVVQDQGDFKVSYVTPEAPKKEVVQDQGDFKVSYVTPEDPLYQNIQRELQKSRAFEIVAEGLNDVFALPRDITIVPKECGIENAFYDPSTSQIIMCYELLEYFVTLFSENLPEESEAASVASDAYTFVFYHELGHALVDVYNLPITGKEEDAVDQLSTIVLLEAGEEGQTAVEGGAAWFYLEGEKTEDLVFWGEHSLDSQRFYNIVCWFYGKDPQKHSYIVEEGILPEDRAVRCPGEYKRMADGWDRLLAPYVKIVE
jgi:hypothetical protein